MQVLSQYIDYGESLVEHSIHIPVNLLEIIVGLTPNKHIQVTSITKTPRVVFLKLREQKDPLAHEIPLIQAREKY